MLGGETLCGGMAWLSGLEFFCGFWRSGKHFEERNRICQSHLRWFLVLVFLFSKSTIKLCIVIGSQLTDAKHLLASFGWNTMNPRKCSQLDQKRCLPSWVKHFVTQRLGETVTVKMSKRAKSEMIFYDFRSNIRQVLLNHLIWWRVARSLGQAPAQWASKTFANVHSSARKSHKRRMFCKRAFDSHVTGVSLYVITGVFIVERVDCESCEDVLPDLLRWFFNHPCFTRAQQQWFSTGRVGRVQISPQLTMLFRVCSTSKGLSFVPWCPGDGWLAGHEEWQTDSWKLLQYSDLRCWDIFLEPEFFLHVFPYLQACWCLNFQGFSHFSLSVLWYSKLPIMKAWLNFRFIFRWNLATEG